jgi:hypothetical protein
VKEKSRVGEGRDYKRKKEGTNVLRSQERMAEKIGAVRKEERKYYSC